MLDRIKINSVDSNIQNTDNNINNNTSNNVETVDLDINSTNTITQEDVLKSIQMNLNNNRDLSNKFSEEVYKQFQEKVNLVVQNGVE